MSDVRNWACFGLGTAVTFGTPRLREALWNRVGDRDLDTHWEAVAGLAKRHDVRVRRRVLDALRSGMSGVLDNVWSTILEAAPGYRDAEICDALRRLADRGWEVSRAVAECDAAVSNEGRPRVPRFSGRCEPNLRIEDPKTRQTSANRVAKPDQLAQPSPWGADEVGAAPAYQTAAAPPATSLSIDVDASSRERRCDEASHHQDASVTAQHHRGVAGPGDAHRSC